MQGINNYPVIEPTDHDSGQDKRDLFANHLTSFLRGWEKPFVISITSPWGTGKTFFLKRWQKELEAEGCHSIYFNAWASDYIDDPLDAFIGQIGELILELDKKGKGTTRLNRYWTNTKKYTKYFAKNFGPIVAARLAKTSVDNIQELISEEDQGNVDNDESSIFDEIPKLAEAQASQVITDFLVHQETISYFKENLSKFAQQLRRQSKNFPLVIIVDELDRCRPDFAITLIERIKHFFDVDNIVFVLAMDQTALDAAVAHRYGEVSSDENKQAYLAKFFDMRFILPECNDNSYAKFLADAYNLGGVIDLWGKIEFLNYGVAPMFIDYFAMMSDRFGLAMREQNKVFSFVCYILKTINFKQFGSGLDDPLRQQKLTSLQFFIVSHLAYLFATRKDYYFRLKHGRGNDYISLKEKAPFKDNNQHRFSSDFIEEMEYKLFSRVQIDNKRAKEQFDKLYYSNKSMTPEQIIYTYTHYVLLRTSDSTIDHIFSSIEFCGSTVLEQS